MKIRAWNNRSARFKKQVENEIDALEQSKRQLWKARSARFKKRFDEELNALLEIKDSSDACSILSPFKGKSFCGNQLLESGISYISSYSSACEIESHEDCCMLITDRF